MKGRTSSLARRYREALQAHLRGDARPDSSRADALGEEAIEIGLGGLDLTRIHEKAISQLTPAKCSANQLKSIRRQSSLFFIEALIPIENTNRQLKREVVRRKAAEAALIESEKDHLASLEQSRMMEKRLRMLSHQLLSAQEEERKKISRDLHDQIAQMLAGINVHLATLKHSTAVGSSGFNRRVRDTQRLVAKSVKTVHRFARQLRPAVLDDLGIIPALQFSLKEFTQRSGIRANFTVFAGVEQLSSEKRTVLYRVALEALGNVSQHAKANVVALTIVKVGDAVQLTLSDDGQGFDVASLSSGKNKRLGIIGMQERVEMVGGAFRIDSSPGRGTTLKFSVPFSNRARSSRK